MVSSDEGCSTSGSSDRLAAVGVDQPAVLLHQLSGGHDDNT
ncbi:hypothetical protein [Streptomyces sp. T028]